MQYYPGDAYVDWWASSIFQADAITDLQSLNFLMDAEEHKKPVMLVENTPYTLFVQNEATWEAWFEPFFNMIKSHPVIKGVYYSNIPWTAWPQWSHWGDARIEAACPKIFDNYINIMNDKIWLNGGAKETLLEALYGAKGL